MRFRSPARVTAAGLLLAAPIVASMVALSTAVAAAQQGDNAVPPGDPVVRGNGTLTAAAANDPNYGLWALVAVCLIAAGVLLITIERWEARRIRHAET